MEANSLNSNFYPEIPKIDVEPLYEDSQGNKYLGNLRSFVLQYSSDPDSCLALGFYLKEKYDLKNSLYDQMLRQCIVLDNKYYRAIFLLAKLRYKAGYIEDSYFLISLLKNDLPNNHEVQNIYNCFYKMNGQKPDKPDSFQDYLYEDYYYAIE